MSNVTRFLNLKFPHFTPQIRKCTSFKTKHYRKVVQVEDKNELIKKVAPKLIYNSVLEKKYFKYEKEEKLQKQIYRPPSEPLALTLKYVYDDIKVEDEAIKDLEEEKAKLVNFPYAKAGLEVALDETEPEDQTESFDIASAAREEVERRHQLQKDMSNWMTHYDSYDDSSAVDPGWSVNYGTPDPKCKISEVPCGGCGAFLHCKDTAIPGYIPSEIFKNCNVKGGATLQAVICQRCHFLKHHNLALQVQVSPDDYPKVLQTVSKNRGLVILMVDLLDFPCSVWPGIGEIFQSHTPIVVVGNKVDLLPQDSRKFLQRVKQVLLDSVKLQGFATFNIKDVALISAKTGYGIEDLITKLNQLHRVKGDVYIVGCTNVGKSSLFNAFLQSDYCKSLALDLIQRATTSVWPGTTLNLLKFPIKRPAGFRQYLRHKRLELQKKSEQAERELRKEQLKKTRLPQYASLIGHLDVTKVPDLRTKTPDDLFRAPNLSNDGITKLGINEKSEEFIDSKWCFDTPGVVQPDQIIHLLTTDELLLTLPRELIVPRTYCLKPKTSLFIAGLARLDYVEGKRSTRLTVFCSNQLPITVCDLDEADWLYDELLGSDLLVVPNGNSARISKWPKLQVAKEFEVIGKDWYKSVKDVVLSNAGWIALTGYQDLHYRFRAWTPEKRGVYLRDCLLPHAVALSGIRRHNSIGYNKFRFYLQ